MGVPTAEVQEPCGPGKHLPVVRVWAGLAAKQPMFGERRYLAMWRDRVGLGRQRC